MTLDVESVVDGRVWWGEPRRESIGDATEAVLSSAKTPLREEGEPFAVANGYLPTTGATMTVVLDFVNGAF
jgi:hypothetical protein